MKSFYKKFFLLMLPMALKELISSLVNLIDTIMVGQLGDNAIAAVGIGNQFYFIFNVFLFGISCGAGVFASQYWGTRDIKGIRRVLGLSLILGSLFSLLFIITATCFPAQIFQAFKASPAVIQDGVTYLGIVSIGYLPTAITIAYDMNLCSSEQAGLPFLVRVLGLFINIFLNWVLIFGHLGVPALGIKGAAIATVIARCSEMLIILGTVYGKKMIQAAKPLELFSISKDLLVRFIKTASPVILNEMAWSLGMTYYTWVFARISPNAMVIMTIVQNIERLMLVFFHGSGNAAGVFIGKSVGAGKYKDAYTYAKKLAYLLTGFSLAFTVVFIFTRPLMLLPYQVSETVRQSTMDILFITALMMNIKSITFLLIVGVFRNGGDPQSAFYIDTGTVWLVGVPAVTIAAFVFHLPLLTAYAIMSVEEIAKLTLSLWWFKKKKWIKNLVAEN